MKLTGFWHDFLAQMGNEPGPQMGNVTIHFIEPVDGLGSVTGPSGAVEVAAEAGSLIGVMIAIDGRRLFVPATNIAGIVDTAKEDKAEKRSGRSSATSS